MEPLIHLLYDSLKELLVTVVRRICKKISVEKTIQNENLKMLLIKTIFFLHRCTVCGDAVGNKLLNMT